MRDALRVSGQDLVLHLVDGPVDGGDELLPADTKSLHGVLAVPVFEHERLLESAFKIIFLSLSLNARKNKLERLSVARYISYYNIQNVSGWKPTNLTSVFTLRTSIYRHLMVLC